MTEPVPALFLLAAIAAISIGGARIVSWLLDRRDYTASQQSRGAAIVAQARAELAASGWTAEDEAALRSIRAQQGVTLRYMRGSIHGL